MGIRALLRRRHERSLDRLVVRVDAHRPDASGSCAAKRCKHVFDGTDEDLRRHHLDVAYRLGENGVGVIG